jgi:hypothetical protein
MILFQAQIEEHQKLADHYRELASQRETLAAGLLAIQEQADSDLSSLKLLLSKCKEVAPNAITSLKTAVLGLFDSGNDDGGNEPADPTPDSDPTPGADDAVNESEPLDKPPTFTPGSVIADTFGSFGVVIGDNNLGMRVDWLGLGEVPNPASGKGVWFDWKKDEQAIASLKPASHDRVKLLTTSEFLQFQGGEDEQLDEHWDNEWFDVGVGCQCKWGGATINRWIVVFADSCEWASPFATPIACQTWEDAPLLGQHCTIIPSTAEDNKNNSTKEGEDMPKPPSTEMIHLSANCGYLKLKADGRILAAYCWFSRKNIAESWMQQIEVIPTVSVEMRESQRNSSWKWELKVTGLSMTQIERLAKEALHQKPTKSTESLAQAAGIEPPSGWGKPQPDPMTCILGEGDVVEVVTHRHPAHHGLIGTVEAVAKFSELSLQVKTPRGIKGYQRDDLKLVSKAEKPQQPTGLQAGTVLMGNRIVTTGNYTGLARRNAINNVRSGLQDKLAALELIKAGVSHEEAIAAVTGSTTASDDYDF